MRGDLVKTTVYTDNNLRQLYDFSATTANKYDSAYVYYRVVNNCNYYIAHCDTAQYRGSTNVVIDKYVAAKAIRAWAYLQLGRNYQRVPFFTEPLTKISQIESGAFPEYSLDEIVAALAPDLEQYTGSLVPSFGYEATNAGYAVGAPGWTSTKYINPHFCFVPVDVVLGDMYLETGQFDPAARHYITYLTKAAYWKTSPYMAPMASKTLSSGRFGMNADDDLPNRSSMSALIGTSIEWSEIFGSNSDADIITFIPMAVSRENGCTTEVPLTFGFNYYATNESNSRVRLSQIFDGVAGPYVDEIQLLPSEALNTLSDSTEYYYYASYSGQSAANLYDSIAIPPSSGWTSTSMPTSSSTAPAPCCSVWLRLSTAWECPMLPLPSSRTASAMHSWPRTTRVSTTSTISPTRRGRSCSLSIRCSPPRTSASSPSIRSTAFTPTVQARLPATLPPRWPRRAARPISSVAWQA